MAHTHMLVRWLNDAYAMEQAKENMLDQYAKDFTDFTEIHNDLKDLQDDARQHADDIQTCLHSLDASVSKAKSVLGELAGMVEGLGTHLYKDEYVKDMLMLHAGLHLAHGSYVALTEAALGCDEPEIADMCRQLAKEEKAAAEWAETQIPATVAAAYDLRGGN